MDCLLNSYHARRFLLLSYQFRWAAFWAEWDTDARQLDRYTVSSPFSCYMPSLRAAPKRLPLCITAPFLPPVPDTLPFWPLHTSMPRQKHLCTYTIPLPYYTRAFAHTRPTPGASLPASFLKSLSPMTFSCMAGNLIVPGLPLCNYFLYHLYTHLLCSCKPRHTLDVGSGSCYTIVITSFADNVTYKSMVAGGLNQP